ncbi:TetR/AcrR family transcriptional regulator [Nocardia jejuensis]|uniref:TetR/AcrR family transcriptional regulator n=1 Tax=Nocardia jejuensis TaxID=328049 RepID=UPI000830F28C|nr:TetR family transcriptional regulator [Nocardia jejuensis]
MNHTTAGSPPRRLRADAVRNQQRIVEAARQLFAERGLEITLDDVAERAGVGVGTVYRRFAGKQELIAEVFAANVSDFVIAAETAATHPDPWDGLVQFFEYACTHLATNRGLSEVMLELDNDLASLAQVRDRIKPTVAALVDRAREAGAIQHDIEASDFFALVHMVDALAEFAKPVNPDIWKRYQNVVLNGVRTDATPRRPLTAPALTDEQIEMAKSHICTARKH